MAARVLVFLLGLGLLHAELLNLSCQQVREFVDGHNSRRLLLAQGKVAGQPAASKMTSLIWDEELAAKASKWAKNNNFMHNPDSTLQSERFRVGENLYFFSTTNKNHPFDIDSGLKGWFDEHKDYKFKAISHADFSGRSKATGHYTQMVWAETKYVGCAISKYPEGRWINYLVVCNYGPAGNIVSQKPYPTGKPSNTLVCGAKNCSQPYGSKCASTFRSHLDSFLRFFSEN